MRFFVLRAQRQTAATPPLGLADTFIATGARTVLQKLWYDDESALADTASVPLDIMAKLFSIRSVYTVRAARLFIQRFSSRLATVYACFTERSPPSVGVLPTCGKP